MTRPTTGQNTDVTKEQPEPRKSKSVGDMLRDPKIHAQMLAMLGSAASADRWVKICLQVVGRNPKLQLCTPLSLLGCFLSAARTGLEPNDERGLSYIIPYQNSRQVRDADGNPTKGDDGRQVWEKIWEAQFQIGYLGIVSKLWETGVVVGVGFGAVRERDTFEYQEGSRTFLNYRINMTEDRGALVGAWAHVAIKLEGGAEGQIQVVVPVRDVYRARARSQTFLTLSRAVDTARNDDQKARAMKKLAETPWVFDEDIMAAKTALKMLRKRAPQTERMRGLNQALALDDAIEDGRVDMTELGRAAATGRAPVDDVMMLGHSDESPMEILDSDDAEPVPVEQSKPRPKAQSQPTTDDPPWADNDQPTQNARQPDRPAAAKEAEPPVKTGEPQPFKW